MIRVGALVGNLSIEFRELAEGSSIFRLFEPPFLWSLQPPRRRLCQRSSDCLVASQWPWLGGPTLHARLCRDRWGSSYERTVSRYCLLSKGRSNCSRDTVRCRIQRRQRRELGGEGDNQCRLRTERPCRQD